MTKRDELFQRKRQAMQLMDAGVSWQEANERSGLGYSKSGVQTLYRKWRERGDEALVDHRHGHPYKATTEVRDYMRERCKGDPKIRASQLTAEIEAEFGVELHHDYVGLLRRQLGLPVPRPGNPGKRGENPASQGEPEVEAQGAQEGPALVERKPEGDFSP